MRLEWDKTGEKIYETGVSKGVLYLPNGQGEYTKGYAWNGLTAVNDTPSGAEPNAQYADNMKYVNIISPEESGGTIEAFTYPPEFEECNGARELAEGVLASGQDRKNFGFSYQTLIGNDTMGTAFGRKIHLVYGATAAPSERSNATVNDSPEAMTLSWEYSTTPVGISTPGWKPTAKLTVSSLTTPAAKLKALEDLLYGTDTVEASLPLPDDIIDLVGVPAGP